MKNSYTIIEDAFRKLGQLGETEVLSTYQINAGRSALISLGNAWIAHGLPPWSMITVAIPFTAFNGDDNLLIGQSGGFMEPTYNISYQPVRLLNAWRQLDGVRTEMQVVPRHTHRNQVDQAEESTPLWIYGEPLQHNVMRLWVYPRPDTHWVAGDLVLDLQYKVSPTYNPPQTSYPFYPDHMEEALIYNLAKRLAPEYGLSIEERDKLDRDAEASLNLALSFNNEEGSVFIKASRI